jgi:hypothetical protein
MMEVSMSMVVKSPREVDSSAEHSGEAVLLEEDAAELVSGDTGGTKGSFGSKRTSVSMSSSRG